MLSVLERRQRWEALTGETFEYANGTSDRMHIAAAYRARIREEIAAYHSRVSDDWNDLNRPIVSATMQSLGQAAWSMLRCGLRNASQDFEADLAHGIFGQAAPKIDNRLRGSKS